jgi:hypothetical protein
MEKKQTAVEWLVEQLIPNAMRMFDATTCNAIEQAKQMEKEQIIDAIVQVMMKQLNICSESGIIQLVNNAEQYYNETYGGTKN